MKNDQVLKNKKLILLMLFLLVLGCVFFTDVSFADSLDQTKSFNSLLDLIQKQSNNWYSKLHYYGFRLFWSLAVFQLLFSFIPLLFKQSDIADFFGEFVKFILVIGFFAALLEYSQEWGTAIIESFRTAAADASGRGRGLFPGDIMGEASKIMEAMANVSTWNPITAVLIAIQSVIVFLCFGFIAVLLAISLIESYIVINASVIFMGFGASQWTREISITTFRYAVSVGAKLFVMTLLVTLITDSMISWKNAYVYSSASNWTLLGLALLSAYLTKTIPEIVAGLISGSSGGTGATIGAMSGAAVGAAVAVASGGVSAAAGGASTAGGTGSVLGGGASGGTDAGVSGSGSVMGAGNNINASQMTGNSFKDSGNKPQFGGNPRVAGGGNQSTRTNQPQAGLVSLDQAGLVSLDQAGSVSSDQAGLVSLDQAGSVSSDQAGLVSLDQAGSVSLDQAGSISPDQAGSVSSKLRNFADTGLRVSGTMASLCVPGMEGAENLNLNTPYLLPENNDIQFSNNSNPQSNEMETSSIIENTISGTSSEIERN
ncbi:P-type conjugative transfer protein TrbL [Bartonella alsatica]|uniref:P-type conjugative transfer protein TrbL n=1 Tax=Bartonella alsatica TaxID=52764 RepID=A0ABX6QG27_9HYPH|nr:P-type conjugative transfer protein TrbL [Bartonella alsatica]QLC51795.1 P-type conjugative transfer protein TrbL [Bartonella alsatica]